MKMERIKRSNKNTTNTRFVFWIVVAFLFGALV